MSPPAKPDPAKAWKHVERLLGDEKAKRIGGASRDDLYRELIARGVDPEDARRLVEKAVGVAPARSRNRRRIAWLAAAAFAGLFATVLSMNRAPLLRYVVGEPIGPDDTARSWKPAPTPWERAAQIREGAYAACEQVLWAKCGDMLDEARDLDPAGEADPRVQRTRRDVYAAEHPDGGVPSAR